MGTRHRKSFGGAVKRSLFAAEEREDRIDGMGDTLLAIEQTIDFGAIAARVDEVAPRLSRWSSSFSTVCRSSVSAV